MCNKKCDALKGQKLRTLPNILSLSLSRFTYDFETMERKRLNDRLEFGLELDLRPYTEKEDS